eukprot:CAMPEP_0206014998 /NCGR_PEP_ID=MMETSP1464-20131121/19239_1 /ASSEMBLY_ACC=CAM_ASM_001124 /TAXON_ID=119497 /ORGANISM="Exanthemachrysis gayraliae, Strain RCC1523" /LENGTH=270 /DNA_ID=CAMNT_0053388771 /DNA_START=24 /DNA_END=836 /DNA_ORIENTATION=+
MGALHGGHQRLIRQSVGDGNLTVVSIFVNPSQFGPTEDFDRYPRQHDVDCGVAEQAGAQVAWIPDDRDVYPFIRQHGEALAGPAAMRVEAGRLGQGLCGSSRPHFFAGVCTVVMKLFNLCRPDIAYFGEKDWQQLAVIRRMVAEFHMGIDVRGVPTVREPDGLAMSSRNRYLRPEQRSAALALYRAIERAQTAYARGQRSAADLQADLWRSVVDEGNPGLRMDYLELRDPRTMLPADELRDDTRLLLAAWLGEPPVRLIDNAPLHPGHAQ